MWRLPNTRCRQAPHTSCLKAAHVAELGRRPVACRRRLALKYFLRDIEFYQELEALRRLQSVFVVKVIHSRPSALGVVPCSLSATRGRHSQRRAPVRTRCLAPQGGDPLMAAGSARRAQLEDMVLPDPEKPDTDVARYGCIVMERGEYDLAAFMKRQGRRLDTLQLLSIMHQLLKALNYVHSQCGEFPWRRSLVAATAAAAHTRPLATAPGPAPAPVSGHLLGPRCMRRPG